MTDIKQIAEDSTKLTAKYIKMLELPLIILTAIAMSILFCNYLHTNLALSVAFGIIAISNWIAIIVRIYAKMKVKQQNESTKSNQEVSYVF